MKYSIDWKEYSRVARAVGAQGAVLIKNEGETLPLKKGEKVAIFGRTQFDYITTGTGSGGMVNVPYSVNMYDAMVSNGSVSVDETVSGLYRDFIKENPMDLGHGWASQPYFQKELIPSDEDIKKAAQRDDSAIVIIGRIAGEDRDNTNTEGSYLLTKDEIKLLSAVRKEFKKVTVVINAGNIIDMKWMDETNPDAVIYTWQGGCESGNAVADVLTGIVNPSGCLADTIANDYSDYPSADCFGTPVKALYKEDIYVGYRYFETFNKEAVRYPFGYGLSYTTFDSTYKFETDGENITVKADVRNTGKYNGRHVVQVYLEAPQGKLGKPVRALAAFGKTNTLFAGASETIDVSFALKDMASYDDSGVTGYRDCFVLEAGEYTIYAGDNVRDAVSVGSLTLADTVCVEKTSHALYPMTELERMVPRFENGVYKVNFEKAPLRSETQLDHVKTERAALKEIPYKGDLGIKLTDVASGKNTLDEFVSQLTDEDMIIMSRGEGMCSVRVTPGVASAFGGMSDRLEAMDIAACACSDGPSGIRMDCGTYAMQSPSGNAVACTFDTKLIGELYTFVGKELRSNKIDCLLGPGMNLRRNPLNGRNFEYFSEDPLLTGSMAAAELKALHSMGVTGVCKHFACNSQEFKRHSVDSVVSARALRELYLKGFEMAVKDGGAYAIMTTYGQLNGSFTGSNFDLNGLVLRTDWGFEGLTMTDWWAKLDEEGGEGSVQNTSMMIRSENDTYMVTASSEFNANGDNSADGLKNGSFTRSELQRNTKNILKAVMKTLAFKRVSGEKDEIEVLNFPATPIEKETASFELYGNDYAKLDAKDFDTKRGAVNLIHLHVDVRGYYDVAVKLKAEAPELAQITCTTKINEKVGSMITLSGADKDYKEMRAPIDCTVKMDNYIKVCLAQEGAVIDSVEIVMTQRQ